MEELAGGRCKASGATRPSSAPGAFKPSQDAEFPTFPEFTSEETSVRRARGSTPTPRVRGTSASSREASVPRQRLRRPPLFPTWQSPPPTTPPPSVSKVGSRPGSAPASGPQGELSGWCGRSHATDQAARQPVNRSAAPGYFKRAFPQELPRPRSCSPCSAQWQKIRPEARPRPVSASAVSPCRSIEKEQLKARDLVCLSRAEAELAVVDALRRLSLEDAGVRHRRLKDLQRNLHPDKWPSEHRELATVLFQVVQSRREGVLQGIR